MNHRQRIEANKAKHAPPPEFDYEFWEKLEQAVKDKADNQGDIDGRDTED